MVDNEALQAMRRALQAATRAEGFVLHGGAVPPDAARALASEIGRVRNVLDVLELQLRAAA